MTKYPRVLIAGSHSGCGKTTVTCGLLAALKNRGLEIGAFKCGPDYIDPLFHREALGLSAHNLDAFFCPPRLLRALLARYAGRDLSVIEGAMGYYDGIGLTGKASAYEVAAATQSPVILVINTKGMGHSAGALIKGYASYREDSGLKGVIFNQASSAAYKSLRTLALEQGLCALGNLPAHPDLSIPGRKLGLVAASEIPDFRVKLEKLARLAAENLDIDAILALAAQAGPLPEEESAGADGDLCTQGGKSARLSPTAAGRERIPAGQSGTAAVRITDLSRPGEAALTRAAPQSSTVSRCDTVTSVHERNQDGPDSQSDKIPEPKPAVRPVRIAVARDKAFCLCYAENLEMLRAFGCEPVFFSPLRDDALPEQIGGLYLGGGYPELYAEALSANRPLLQALKERISAGLPTIAESGGFAYLHEYLDAYPLVGIIPGRAFMTDTLQHFGYLTLTAVSDNLLLAAGESLRAHEFHYMDSSDNGRAFTAVKAGRGASRPCGHAGKTLYAAFPQLYFPAAPAAARRFAAGARAYAAGAGAS